MNRYQIELTEEQMQLVGQCLEDCSRFASGQWELRYTIAEMLRDAPPAEQMERLRKAEELLRQAKRILLPEFSDRASKNYNGSDFIGNTYQIYRTILHRLDVDNKWNTVYQSPPLPSGTMGTVKITRIEPDA